MNILAIGAPATTSSYLRRYAGPVAQRGDQVVYVRRTDGRGDQKAILNKLPRSAEPKVKSRRRHRRGMIWMGLPDGG